MNQNIYCLVVGSRNFTDYKTMCKALDLILANYTNVVIVSGGAKGADALAHAKYIKTLNERTSWHYSVDDKAIYQHVGSI